MKIIFYKGNRTQRRIVRDAALWFAHKFKLDRFKEEIWVDFAFMKELDYSRRNEPVAFTHAPAEDFRPRDFVIELAPNTPENRLTEIVIHEMIHLNQMATNKLRQPHSGYALWNKRQYKFDDASYKTQPWEIEAYALTKQLLKEYVKQTKLERR